MIDILIAAVGLAIFASIAAWLDTQTIMKDSAEIKKKLDIHEEKPMDLDDD